MLTSFQVRALVEVDARIQSHVQQIHCQVDGPERLVRAVAKPVGHEFARGVEDEPLIEKSPWVEYIGEITDADKEEFLGNAYALLFPIDWPEPFGLAMIESMACGTPVIAFRAGSVPEIIEDGVSGWIVGDVDEAVQAVARVPDLSRAGVRRAFEKRFTSPRMARDYTAIYRRLVREGLALPADWSTEHAPAPAKKRSSNGGSADKVKI